mmetsp:Transcript_3687/g.11703  ORF Transcript_3687/g.11703 Transcript_3687/m.11703 type:complete len:316 (-) Transcript_3687:131-1078(-)
MSRTGIPRSCTSKIASATRLSESVYMQTSRECAAPSIHRQSSSRAAREGKKSAVAACGGAASRVSSRAAASEASEANRSRNEACAAKESRTREALAVCSASSADDESSIFLALQQSNPLVSRAVAFAVLESDRPNGPVIRRRRTAAASSVAAAVSHVACAGFRLSLCKSARHVANEILPSGEATKRPSRAAATISCEAPMEDNARSIEGGMRAARPRRAAWSLVAAAAVEIAFFFAKAPINLSNSAAYLDTMLGSEVTKMFSQFLEWADHVQLNDPVARVLLSKSANLWCMRRSRSPLACRPVSGSWTLGSSTTV